MIFRCKSCGYPNAINSKFKCKACGYPIDDMRYFDKLDSYLEELKKKYPEKLILEPRLARIYFSDYDSPIYKKFKEKYQLDAVVKEIRLDFIRYFYKFIND